MSDTPQNVDVTPALTHEEILEYTQRKRRIVIDHFMDGDKPPNDPKDVSNLLKAMKDMDTATLTNARNNIDESNADSAKRVADAMEENTRRHMNNNPFRRTADGSLGDGPVQETAIPNVTVEKLGHHELVEGEDALEVVEERADEFIARMKALEDAREAGED